MRLRPGQVGRHGTALAAGSPQCWLRLPAFAAAYACRRVRSPSPRSRPRTNALERGDIRLIQRLVANLVEDAVHHNVPDGSITVAAAVRHGRATLSVANTGPVIEPHKPPAAAPIPALVEKPVCGGDLEG